MDPGELKIEVEAIDTGELKTKVDTRELKTEVDIRELKIEVEAIDIKWKNLYLK